MTAVPTEPGSVSYIDGKSEMTCFNDQDPRVPIPEQAHFIVLSFDA